MRKPLKAPFPYPGGKSKIASVVWAALGDVDNYVEAFCGSAANLLGRPHPPRIETLNDADCFVSNFWRSVQHDPEAVAEHADWPVSEIDLHARHRWLVGVDPRSPWSDTPYLHAMTPPSALVRQRREFRERMRSDPDYYDVRTAGWWCWGLCCWIGSGWCSVELCTDGLPREKRVRAVGNFGTSPGVNSAGPPASKVRIAAHNKGSVGKGVHAKGQSEQLPKLASGDGVPSTPSLSQKLPIPRMTNDVALRAGPRREGGRPQLADAYDIGRGVNSQGDLGTCAERRAWLVDWFSRLRDRLRLVRVCCGDWLRVCDSKSVTTRLGVTGLFFDPPYGYGAGRTENLYSVDSLDVAKDVRDYCLERGANPQIRIVLAGYKGEGHEVLEQHGWTVTAWKAPGGYANRSSGDNKNRDKERLWMSPHCHKERSLFDSLEDTP